MENGSESEKKNFLDKMDIILKREPDFIKNETSLEVSKLP